MSMSFVPRSHASVLRALALVSVDDYSFTPASGDYRTTYDRLHGPDPEDSTVLGATCTTHFADRGREDAITPTIRHPYVPNGVEDSTNASADARCPGDTRAIVDTGIRYASRINCTDPGMACAYHLHSDHRRVAAGRPRRRPSCNASASRGSGR